jgi:hypothetical protein
MKSFVMNDIQRLAFDASRGVSREGLTKDEINEAIKNSIKEACGGEWNYYNFMGNKHKVFALISEMLPVAMHANLIGKFERFADIHDDILVGDKPYWKVESNELYPVVTCARGNQDIERNRIVDKQFTIATQTKGLKFYEELDYLMSGRMDFARLTEVVSMSMSNYIGELIANTIYGSYSAVGTNYKTTGAWDASTFNTLVEHVKAANGVNSVNIFGTTTALSNVVDAFGYSDAGKDSANTWGYYGEFRGNSLIALPQSYTAGSFGTFHVDTNHLIVVPATNEKIVKVLIEGEAFVNMTEAASRNDLQSEILFQRRIGAGALTANEGRYGFYKFS